MENVDIDKESRPAIWKTICSIDDGLLPFVCGATISTGLSTMLESTFEFERFFSGISMFITSAFVFWWYVCLSRIKREIQENKDVDNEARHLSDKKIWDKYYKPEKTKMRILIVLTLLFIVIWGVFLTLSYCNNNDKDVIPSTKTRYDVDPSICSSVSRKQRLKVNILRYRRNQFCYLLNQNIILI
ncbi:hypothetical protein AGMMS50268_37980 [Spirochaetia bacterium]|nr:hypothetical protein AGMMS50268_37980 [Spirochaetia bacterium]